MSAWTEMLGDRTIGGKESLRLTRRFESLHPPLTLARGLMRVLCAIVQIPVLAMFYIREELALCGSVALEFVGHDHAWDIR